MADELLTVKYWLAQGMASAPLLIVLVAGMVICYRQRRRRPCVAKWVGWAMLAEFVWITVGSPLVFLAASNLLSTQFFEFQPDDGIFWMVRMILYALPGSTVSAAIWGTVLWAVLQVDDWREDSAGI